MITENDIISWINRREFFWLSDLKKDMGFVYDHYATEPNEIELLIKHAIDKFKKNGFIQCSEIKGVRRQYFRTSLIPLNTKQ